MDDQFSAVAKEDNIIDGKEEEEEEEDELLVLQCDAIQDSISKRIDTWGG